MTFQKRVIICLNILLAIFIIRAFVIVYNPFIGGLTTINNIEEDKTYRLMNVHILSSDYYVSDDEIDSIETELFDNPTSKPLSFIVPISVEIKGETWYTYCGLSSAEYAQYRSNSSELLSHNLVKKASQDKKKRDWVSTFNTVDADHVLEFGFE